MPFTPCVTGTPGQNAVSVILLFPLCHWWARGKTALLYEMWKGVSPSPLVPNIWSVQRLFTLSTGSQTEKPTSDQGFVFRELPLKLARVLWAETNTRMLVTTGKPAVGFFCGESGWFCSTHCESGPLKAKLVFYLFFLMDGAFLNLGSLCFSVLILSISSLLWRTVTQLFPGKYNLDLQWKVCLKSRIPGMFLWKRKHPLWSASALWSGWQVPGHHSHQSERPASAFNTSPGSLLQIHVYSYVPVCGLCAHVRSTALFLLLFFLVPIHG